MNVEFINTTPRDIVIVNDDKSVVRTFAKSGVDVRQKSAPQKEISFPTVGLTVVNRQIFTSVEGLADLPDASWILVSMPVGEYFASNRHQCKHWVFGPDTGPAAVVRDEKGQICGTKRLVFYSAPDGVETIPQIGK